MADRLYRRGFRFYQSANADAESIKEGFIIRMHEYDIIMQDIRRNPMRGSVQHYLLLGRRGSGKSTLLKRIQVEIDADTRLRKTHIAINLAEEQANIYKLYDLLEAIIRELEYRSIESEATACEEDEQVYARNLFAALHTAVVKSGKKLVLLLDNIDRIFENLNEDASLLREYLLNYDDVKIIGGSTRMTEHFWKYNKPFYQFFRVLELKPLSSSEIKKLLLHWADKSALSPLREFVEQRAGQLETVRILTDGLPRTLQFFVDILLAHSQETGYEYLRLIMDKVTPLYQERLNSLPPAQRKIVLQMAFLWEAKGAKELAAATHMDNKVISAQLKQLADKGIAEKIETTTKNHLYRLSERFFNLWLIFTQGSPNEKRKAKYLTIFLENFYDTTAVQQMAIGHLDILKDKKITAGKAVLLTKALAQSKYITSKLRDELIKCTLDLKGVNNELKQQMPLLSVAVWRAILKSVRQYELDKALQLAEEYEQDDGVRDLLLGFVYYMRGIAANGGRFFDHSLQKGGVNSLRAPGSLGRNNEQFDLAEKYLLQADDKHVHDAIYYLAHFYYMVKPDKDKADFYITLTLCLLLGDDDTHNLYVCINAWLGQMGEAINLLMQLIESKDYGNMGFTLRHLLVHHQSDEVYKLFNHDVFGKELQETFQPIYYAAGLMIKQDGMLALKIPPELRETVEDILQEVKKERAFYYGAEAANA